VTTPTTADRTATSSTRSERGGWQPTFAHMRAVSVAVACALAAVVWRRADLLVLAAPFAAVAAWSLLARPTATPSLTAGIDDHTLTEGDATTWRASLAGCDEVDVVVAAMPPTGWVDRRPASGVASTTAVDGTAAVSIVVASTRWGRRAIEPVPVVATSAWAAFRWSTTSPLASLTTLPLAAGFDARATFHPSDGLVGVNRAVRPGEGSEFASVRPFQPGDRLRRINWPRSTRSGTLQASATWADQDTHVVLVVDASSEVGRSEGIGGRASSLDTTVRAAAAIAEHYALHGERVSLRVLGSTSVPVVAASSGRAHLRRLHEALTLIKPPTGRAGRGFDPRLLHSTGQVLAVMLSPLVTADALDAAVAIGRHGSTVAVVDTLPADLGHRDANAELAWRIRLLERRNELRAVQELGLPVIAWRGPDSLDGFLRDVARRSQAPRMRQR
jgi:uncharacterized protein (DUF58 family)